MKLNIDQDKTDKVIADNAKTLALMKQRINKANKEYSAKLEKLIHENIFKNGTQSKDSIGGLGVIVNNNLPDDVEMLVKGKNTVVVKS
jgi:hypothetical protein